MAADDHRGDAVVGTVLRALHPHGVAGEAAGEVLQQVEAARQHVLRRQRGQRRHGEVAGQLFQRLLAAGVEALAAAAVAGVDQDDAAMGHELVERRHLRARQRRAAGHDRPIEQRVERKLRLAERDGRGLAQRGVGAAVHVVRQPGEAGAGDAVHRGVAGDNMGEAGDERGMGRSLRRDQGLRLRRQGGGQQQDCRPRGNAATNQAAQEQGDHEVDREQGQRGGEQPRREQAFRRGARHRLLPRPRDRRGGGERGMAAGEVQRAAAVLRAVQPRRVARGGGGGGEIARRDRPGGGLGRAERAETVQRFHGRKAGVVCFRHAGNPGRKRNKAAQHVHEQARERQVRPIGIRRGVEQHHPAEAAAGMGHQRGAIRQPRPGGLGEAGIGLGQHLAGHAHLGRHAQPGEGGGGGEGIKPGRLAPGHGTTQLAIAGQQLHRQQRIRLLGHAWPGKAQQQAAFFHPVGEHGLLGATGHHVVHQHQHGEVARQQRGEVAQAQLHIRIERAAHIIQRAGKRNFGRHRIAGQQPHRAAAPAFIQQHHAAGRGRALDHQAGQAVAQLRRQQEGDLGLRRAGRDGGGGAGQGAGVAGLGEHGHLLGQRAGGLLDGGDQPVRLGARGEQQAGRRHLVAQHGHGPDGAQRGGERIPAGAGEAIGDIGSPTLAGPGAQRGGGGGAIRRPRLRAQGREAGAHLAHRHGGRGGRCRGGFAGRGGHQHHLPPRTLRAIQHPVRRRHAARPIRRGGPAVIHHQHQRPTAGQGGAGIDHRASEAHNHQRSGQDAQRQQPPRRARRRLLRRRQPEQQADRREGFRARARRRNPQQPPQYRQGGQRQQHPGRGKDHRRPACGASAV